MSTEYKIELKAPTAAESQRPSDTKDQPYRVGFGRELPAAERRIALDKLDWQPALGGEFMGTISIRSPGAKSLRVGVQSQSIGPLKLFFRGRTASNSEKAQAGIPMDAGGPGIFWSPVVQGDTVWIDVRVSALPASGAVLEIPLVSHLR
ncbi:MAG TPA: hypothetical protein VK629_03770 [Steroidobacteraceae bacterium]|nr:hypothetical protein [Steroidobacteraceae bacterium]